MAMKKIIKTVFAFLICFVNVGFSSCGNVSTSTPKHVCEFNQQKVEEKYLVSKATCQNLAKYYFSCECGEHGTEFFESGTLLECKFTVELATEEYLKQNATCQSLALYYKSCETCGQKGNETQTFTYGECKPHEYSQKVVQEKYLRKEATKTEPATYYKTCVCGESGEEYFSYGEPLEFTDEEKIPYIPVSLTVSLYDTENSIYGFTCNTRAQPISPVLQVSKSDFSMETVQEYPVKVEKFSSYEENDQTFDYYIWKSEAKLEKNTAYSYRIFDKVVRTGTPVSTLQTKDVESENFTFAHVADTQAYPSNFNNVLKSMSKTTDFILHTGDVVNDAKYEYEWTDMLQGNFEYLSKIPMQAIAGNHETTYATGLQHETYKHFHNKLPSQETTKNGYFYSFTYGNAKFIMLNTNSLSNRKLKDEQFNWLVNELKNNTAKWTIVAMHNPIYGVGQYGLNPEKNLTTLSLRNQLQGLFAQYGVDIVLQGHDHTIARTKPINASGKAQAESFKIIDGVDYSVNPNGVLYLENGTSGGQDGKPYYGTSSDIATLYRYTNKPIGSMWAEFAIDGNVMKVSLKYYKDSQVVTFKEWGIIKKTFSDGWDNIVTGNPGWTGWNEGGLD